jgi:type IV pilus assembly protein PilN
MIRINLLPMKAVRKRNTALLQLAGITIAISLAVGGALGVNWYYGQQIEQQEQEIAEAKAEIARLKKIIGEVNELDKQKKRLIAQLSVIEKLEKGKRGPVRVLDELSSSIPKRVWITGFTEKNGKLALSGVGLENADISEFMRALQKSKYFGNVTLSYTQSKVARGINIYQFRLSAQVNYAA